MEVYFHSGFQSMLSSIQAEAGWPWAEKKLHMSWKSGSREKVEELGREIHPSRSHSLWKPHLTRPHLTRANSAIHSPVHHPTNEHSTPMVRSPSKSAPLSAWDIGRIFLIQTMAYWPWASKICCTLLDHLKASLVITVLAAFKIQIQSLLSDLRQTLTCESLWKIKMRIPIRPIREGYARKKLRGEPLGNAVILKWRRQTHPEGKMHWSELSARIVERRSGVTILCSSCSPAYTSYISFS